MHLKTALSSIKRSPFQAMSAIFVLSLTFFVATTVAVIVLALNNILNYFETRPQIIAFLKDSVSQQELESLENLFKSDVRIKDYKYVSKEQALEIYKKATQDNPLLSELVSPSIFPASFELSVVELSFAQNLISELQNVESIEQVGFTANLGGQESLDDALSRLKDISYYVRLGGIVFVSFLTLTSFLVLLVIVSMRMVSRKGEIEILSLIGATKSFVSWPIIIESIIYGMSGVLIGWTLSFILWLYVSPILLSYFAGIAVLPTSPLMFFTILGLILLVEIVAGILISLIGSLIAINRSLKK